MSLSSINIAQTSFFMSRSVRQGQSSNQGYTMRLHTHKHQCSYQVTSSYTLWFLRYSPDKILYVNVTTARSKVKSRSHHDVAHLQPPINVPTKYQLPTPYGFRDTAWTTFYRSRSLWHCLFGVLRRFQHCTGHITMGSRAEETSTYSSLGFCTVNCRPMASNYQLSHLRP